MKKKEGNHKRARQRSQRVQRCGVLSVSHENVLFETRKRKLKNYWKKKSFSKIRVVLCAPNAKISSITFLDQKFSKKNKRDDDDDDSNLI